ncbi:MAG: hypothetical protein ABSF93_03285 [Candidatus Sulfotelmatobacter sp.]|jgi:hypothetical protein
MVLLAMIRREWIHALLRMPGKVIISRPGCAVNGEMAEFGGSLWLVHVLLEICAEVISCLR